MNGPLIEARGLVKRFGGLVATGGVDIDLRDGEVHAVIGPNGAGKTTLVAQLAGELRPDAGSVFLAGRNVTRLPPPARAARGLARSFQITSVFRAMTALDNVALAVQAHAGHSFRFWQPVRREPELREPARRALARVGLERRAMLPAGTLSHGEQRQLELAMALAGDPLALLLDEPTAGMGLDETRAMVELLYSLKGTLGILLIEHDMEVVFSLADRVTVLVGGRVIASGFPAAIRADEEVRRAYLGEEELTGA